MDRLEQIIEKLKRPHQTNDDRMSFYLAPWALSTDSLTSINEWFQQHKGEFNRSIPPTSPVQFNATDLDPYIITFRDPKLAMEFKLRFC